MPGSHRRPGETERKAIDEQLPTSPAEWHWHRVTNGLRAADPSAAPGPPPKSIDVDTVRGVAALMEACPPPFRPWLQCTLHRYARNPNADLKRFLILVGYEGLVGAVLTDLKFADSDDARYRGHRLYCEDPLANEREFVAAVLRYVLDADADPHRRAVAAKWLPCFVTGAELIDRLIALIRLPPDVASFHAACTLAELAPQTPGLPAHVRQEVNRLSREELLSRAEAEWLDETQDPAWLLGWVPYTAGWRKFFLFESAYVRMVDSNTPYQDRASFFEYVESAFRWKDDTPGGFYTAYRSAAEWVADSDQELTSYR